MLHAVVIGIDHYADEQIPNLSFAGADARAFADLLQRRVEPSELRLTLLVDQAATKRAISKAVGDDLYRLVETDDIVIVYFAGHGCPERVRPGDKASRYLLTHDTEYSAIYASAIGMEAEIPVWLERIAHAKVVTIFLDCCFSGAASGRTVNGPLLKLAGLKMMSGGVQPISLKELNLGRGRVILCAADEDQPAQESAELQHGVFTHRLLCELAKPRSSRTILLTHLYEEVAASVRRDTNGEQEPVLTALWSKQASLPSLAETP